MFDEHQDSYNQVYSEEEHEGHFSHELLAGGASFFAVYEGVGKRQRSEGKEVDHAFAKEMIAGIAGGEIDKLVETKGLDYIDTERAKQEARDQIDRHYDNTYGNSDNWSPNNDSPYANY